MAVSGGDGARPVGLVVAALGLFLESLGAASATVALAVALARGDVDSVGLALGGVVVGLGAALVLIRLGRALLGAQAWVRAPVVVVQLLLLPVGWSVRGSTGRGAEVVGSLLLLVAVVVLVAVLSPGAGAALGPRRAPG